MERGRNMKHPIVIVGAGLSGLHAASKLTAEGIPCRVLEARDRIGGRTLSTAGSNRPDLGKFDLGATWFWPQYENTIVNLVKQLHLETFPQYTKGAMLAEQSHHEAPKRFVLPDNPNALSMRFRGGVQSLINAIAETIPPGVIDLNTQVKAIQIDTEDTITVESERTDGKRDKIVASAVILALPPRIIAKHIEFSPSLSPNLQSALLDKATWMAGQAKAVILYDRPFWRESDLSGFVSSRVGPLQEIHDASPETGCGALFGFIGIPANIRWELGENEMKEMIMDQLSRLFGEEAQNPEAILYKDWSKDIETAVEEDWEPLRNFPVYGLERVTGQWQNKLFFAGTESDSQFGGHLEGALRSAERAVYEMIKFF